MAAGAWREGPDPSDAGGLLADLGSHMIDQAIQLFGPPVRVYAEVDRRREGARVDDDVFVALTHPGGERSHLWASMLGAADAPPVPGRGPRRHLRVARASTARRRRWPRGCGPGSRGGAARPRSRGGGCGTGRARGRCRPRRATTPPSTRVVGCLRDGAPPPVDPADSVAVLEVIEAAREDAARGPGDLVVGREPPALETQRPPLGQHRPAGEHLGVAQVPDQVRAGAQARVVAGARGEVRPTSPLECCPVRRSPVNIRRPSAGRAVTRVTTRGPARPLEVKRAPWGSWGDLRPHGGNAIKIWEDGVGVRKSVVIRLAGESGEGVISCGDILARRRAHRLLGAHLPDLPGRDQGRAVHVPGAGRRGAGVLQGNAVDLLVCFNQEAFDLHHHELAHDGHIVCDAESVRVTPQFESRSSEVPLAGLAQEAGGGRRGKNMVAVGLVCGLLGIDTARIEEMILKRYAHKGDVGEANIRSLLAGASFARERLPAGGHKLRPAEPEARGARAPVRQPGVCLGALPPGSPTTPATRSRRPRTSSSGSPASCPQFGGIAIQTEDEIAALGVRPGRVVCRQQGDDRDLGPGAFADERARRAAPAWRRSPR